MSDPARAAEQAHERALRARDRAAVALARAEEAERRLLAAGSTVRMGNLPGVGGLLGTLESADGTGVVRMEDRFDTGIDDVWSAVTDPARLARWLGEVEGDLRLGGEFRAHFTASDWKGTGRIDVCEPPQRLLVLTKDESEPNSAYHHPIEVSLTADGDQTVFVWEERGMRADLLAAYGAGIQIHVEDLGAYLAGRGRVDARTRWGELEPAYRELALDIGQPRGIIPSG